jgi:quercetin dioxygenase-like cupin family protein
LPTAQANVVVDNDRVRVTKWTFQDGDETGHHRHEFDYVVVPVTGGTFVAIDNDGATSDLTQEPATPYQGRAGTEHNVINRSGRAATFVDVELKR